MDVVLLGVVLIAQSVAAPWLGESALAVLSSFIITAWLNEWVVSGKTHRQQKLEADKILAKVEAAAVVAATASQKEIEYWRSMALNAIGHAERAVELAEARR